MGLSEPPMGPPDKASFPPACPLPSLAPPTTVLPILQTGYTLLHWAAERDHLLVLQALLRDPRIRPGERTKVMGKAVGAGDMRFHHEKARV